MELSTAQLTVIVSLFTIFSGVVIVENIESTFYCSTEDNVKECFKLGANETRCFYNVLQPKKYDICTNGKWEDIEKYIPKVGNSNNVQRYMCDTKECRLI